VIEPNPGYLRVLFKGNVVIGEITQEAKMKGAINNMVFRGRRKSSIGTQKSLSDDKSTNKPVYLKLNTFIDEDIEESKMTNE